MTERVLVVVPTYNEIKNLPQIVPEILRQDPRIEVLVVDDGSPDGTGELADRMGEEDPRIHCLHRTKKEGLGKAYLAGFKWALARDYDFIFEMDADFSHDPKYLPGFLRAVEDADLVIGSRYKTGVNVINWPMSRLLLSYGANIYARWITGLPLTDSTGGFKCFRRSVLATLELDRVESNGYSFQIEMSFRAWKRGFRLKEIPIVFVDRVEGQSKMNKKIVREAIWMVWWIRLRSLVGSCERRLLLQDDRFGQRLRDARWPGDEPPGMAGGTDPGRLRPPGWGRGRWAADRDPGGGRYRPDDLLELRRQPGQHVRERRPLQHAPGRPPGNGSRLRDDPGHGGGALSDPLRG